MVPTLNHQHLLELARLSPQEERAVLSCAGSLQRAAEAGTVQPLLRGKRLGLLCELDDEIDAALFRSAAVGLGAHVAQVRPHLSTLSTEEEVRHTARMLGRLYDAVDCEGMSATLVKQVSDAAGIPIYNGLATDAHPIAALAAQLGGDAPMQDKRRFVLQALLLSSIG